MHASGSVWQLSAYPVLPQTALYVSRWIRVISARLERVIRGGDAATVAYETFAELRGAPAASALGFSIVDALALIASCACESALQRAITQLMSRTI